MREEKWRENFLSLGTLVERVEEKITEKIMKVNGLNPGSNYQDYFWDRYRWIDVISLVDKELVNGKRRVLVKFWENGRVLGVNKLANTLLSEWELESVSELKSIIQENIEKFGAEYAKENFSKMVLGGVCLYLSELNEPEQAEAALVPFRIKGENEKGDKEVEFLFLAKLKIGDKAFSLMPISVNYDDKKFNSSDAIQRGTRKIMRVVDQEKIPVELSKEKGKAILINTNLTEKVIVFIASDRENSLVEKIKHQAEAENLKFVRVDVEDDVENISVKEYKEIEKTKMINEEVEEVVIELALKGEMKNLGCFEEKVDKLIRKEIEELAKELNKWETKETDLEKRSGFILAKIIAERILKIIEEGKIGKRECILVGRSDHQNSYQYKIYPDMVIEGEELLMEATKSFPVPEIAKRAKKMIEFLEVEKEKKMCFKTGSIEKKIEVEGMEEILKEPFVLYIKNLSGSLSKMLENQISNVKGVLRELERINKLSVALSGIVASAIEKFPDDATKINEVTKEIYKLLFRSMVGGEIEYYDYGESFGWRREKETFLNWKALIKEMVGLKVRVNITETISVEVHESTAKVKRWLTTSTRKDYGEDLWAVYLDSGYRGKLIEMTVVR